MRTIAFVGQTGGAGKSTIAASLAVAALEMKEDVRLIDMDPQRSLTNWVRSRAARDLEVMASGAARLPALLASLKRAGVTLAILDAPGAEGAASSAAMQGADLAIIPLRPSLFDLRASTQTCAALKEIRRDLVFLLNQCPCGEHSVYVQDYIEALAEMGELTSPIIAARVDYREAARSGFGVTELNPRGPAADEMRSLWLAIARRLAQPEARRPARQAA